MTIFHIRLDTNPRCLTWKYWFYRSSVLPGRRCLSSIVFALIYSETKENKKKTLPKVSSSEKAKWVDFQLPNNLASHPADPCIFIYKRSNWKLQLSFLRLKRAMSTELLDETQSDSPVSSFLNLKEQRQRLFENACTVKAVVWHFGICRFSFSCWELYE